MGELEESSSDEELMKEMGFNKALTDKARLRNFRAHILFSFEACVTYYNFKTVKEIDTCREK